MLKFAFSHISYLIQLKQKSKQTVDKQQLVITPSSVPLALPFATKLQSSLTCSWCVKFPQSASDWIIAKYLASISVTELLAGNLYSVVDASSAFLLLFIWFPTSETLYSSSLWSCRAKFADDNSFWNY